MQYVKRLIPNANPSCFGPATLGGSAFQFSLSNYLTINKSHKFAEGTPLQPQKL